MRGRRIENKIEELNGLVKSLAAEIGNKNGTISQQNEILKNLRSHLDKTMDRLMSRNFQELSTYTPTPSFDQSYKVNELEDMLVGSITDYSTPKREDKD